jgi:hypothetical protein
VIASGGADVRARRAERLGLTTETSFDDVVRAYLAGLA